MDNLHWYRLDPLDVLFFRDSRPFQPGEGSWAKSLFPPLPITVFQALRSLCPPYQERRQDLEFMGPFLIDDKNQVWVATPKDLVCVGSKSNEKADMNDPADLSTVKGFARLQPAPTTDPAWQYICHPLPGKLRPIVEPALAENEQLQGRPAPLMRLDALVLYLQGNFCELKPQEHFHSLPWSSQVLPHIKMQIESRNVEEEAGYFTEVANRLRPGWGLVAGMSVANLKGVVRLGGEGHHAQVQPLNENPLKALTAFQGTGQETLAYVLTPGLAQAVEGMPLYSLYPHDWQDLMGVVGDRPLVAGGISTVTRRSGHTQVSYSVQRAYVPAGTLYYFEQPPTPQPQQLLSGVAAKARTTFEKLHYGQLLWGTA
ncbi:type III-B CRISPR module-associated Cmr3 family protein [Thermosynechococcus sp.]|uniref:type III-B CRISPR module-associated Cmr3 family protein n=1 Tax=Thermosynechococcus sp. TaxID=2814275 RepID=UPI00391A694F